mmetsp:Transcript_43465/g.130378  ORF Transcript_43465/g.130378 Transcript_43465/m.130378 type:complete len:476 (-) Transcript_43465:529-1956(-)
MSLDALKAMKEKMRKEREAAAKDNDKKYITKAELEAARLRKIREEEERERQEKEKKRKVQSDSTDGVAAKKSKDSSKVAAPAPVQLAVTEVMRRLRALGQPATLFGEDRGMREARLMKAEREMKVDDDTIGGQQDNLMLELQRAAKGEAKARAKLKEEHEKKERAQAQERLPGAEAPAATEVAEPEDPTMAAFKAAAAALAARRAEEAMCIEDRIGHYVKRWMKEWGEDLESRPDEVKRTVQGNSATMQYRQTDKYFEALYDRLKHRTLHPELRAGLWMMISAMKERNYLQANDIYLKLAIGNAPWPIGVTQVGIHERSAREKISHVMQSGIAHIMNDEATRKYFQGFKRIVTFLQRKYPTDPSRSINFQCDSELGRGTLGGGSDKLALIEAEKRGEDWRTLGLKEAPHYLEADGSVKVPTKWQYIIGRAMAEGEGGGSGSERDGTPEPAPAVAAAAAAGAAAGRRTPSKTPPPR